MQFAARTEWGTAADGWAAALEQLRTAGRPLLDLTASNPTTAGLRYEENAILAALSSSGAMRYEPDPAGILSARQSVAAYYAESANISVNPKHMLLTASTSEAYSFLFRLLCDSGDELLIPTPGYPLFDVLAALDDVRLKPYPLFYDHGWHIDHAALATAITPRTRAIVVVHPNNPTGHFTSSRERAALEALCREHSLSLIVDEVFLDYAVEAKAEPSFAAAPNGCLTFVLSGLSKIAGLPQMKCAWMAVCGPEQERDRALERLSVIADSYLSVSSPVQHALPVLLGSRFALQQQIRERMAENLRLLDGAIGRAPAVSRLMVAAGWNAVLRVPALERVESLAIRLMQQQNVVVHPGSFYGFSGDGWLVVSLLTLPAMFRDGIERIARHFA